jgi:hypothetical protein
VWGGVQCGSTRHVDHFWPIVPAPGNCEGAEFGGMKIGRGNRSTRRTFSPAPLCPPQIPLDQTRARTRAAAVGKQPLTAWAMARPDSEPMRLIQFRNHFSHTVGWVWRVISPAQGRYLYTGQHKHTINARTDIHAFNRIRTHDLSVRANEYNSCLTPRIHCNRPANIYITQSERAIAQVGFPPRRPGFAAVSGKLGFVDKVRLRQVFSEYFGFPC